MTYPADNLICYDLEVFPGWFLAGFQLPTGEVYQYVCTQSYIDPGLVGFIRWAQDCGYTFAGFNSRGYDDAVLSEFLRTPDVMVAFNISCDIIHHGVSAWRFENLIESIDLMQIIPGRISLKKVGVCLGHSRLQELPIPWDKKPSPEEQQILIDYNRNDLEITRKLLNEIQPELDLRGAMSEQYGVDLRSRGDAAMAEALLLAEYSHRGGVEKKKQLNDRARAIIKTDPLVRVQQPSWWHSIDIQRFPSWETVRQIGEKLFATPIPIVNDRLPKVAFEPVFIGDRYYAMGVGGLHSVDGPGCWIPRDGQVLVDIDVASYYPNIALTQDLAPRPWGEAFAPIYRDIVRRRLDAKKAGDETTAYSLKIAVNGTFGKTSDPYSSLYDPQMTVNITVLGQLGLLTLIAMIDGAGNVVSANTDGITVLADAGNYPQVQAIVSEWERFTGLDMEYTPYRGLWQKDVNNYMALTTDGKVKAKGRFVAKWPDLKHTPNANIVPLAMQALVKDGTPLEQTIYECRDINQFVLTQAVAGDWTTSWNGRALGKMLRFYKSNHPSAAPIIRHPGAGAKGNEGNVPNSESCAPLEDLPVHFPEDMNHAWYLSEAQALWETISQPKTPGMNRWAETIYQAGLRPCYVNPDGPLSRAGVAYGEFDFSSRPAGHVFGTGTGDGLLAMLSDERTDVFQVQRPYPGKTRAKVKKDHSFEIYHGARVPLRTGVYGVMLVANEDEFDRYYTPAELAKVRNK